MEQIKPTATLCGKPHESENAHQSRIRYGEGKAQKRHTLKHRNTRPCLACFRSEIIIIIIIIIIMIIVGYDNNTPFFSPCIRKAEHFNCVWKTQTGSKRQCYLYTNWTRKNNFFSGMKLFLNIFFRLSTGMVGTDSWSWDLLEEIQRKRPRHARCHGGWG